MKRLAIIIVLASFLVSSSFVSAQVNEHEVGAWYMYFWNTKIKESSLGFQGDIQVRNWDAAGDLEQLMLRGGVMYLPKNANAKLTLGYAHITTGAYGDGTSTVTESRIYQEALLPHKVGNRIYLTHRFRYEQRFVESQDFRTRYRYNLFMNIPLNKKEMEKGALYLALYNELFINGQRKIGNGQTVQVFDRNRAYAALGYQVRDNLKFQLGFMEQATNGWKKGQAQISAHHKF